MPFIFSERSSEKSHLIAHVSRIRLEISVITPPREVELRWTDENKSDGTLRLLNISVMCYLGRVTVLYSRRGGDKRISACELLGNECLSLCRCRLSLKLFTGSGLIKTASSQHKSALLLDVLGFLRHTWLCCSSRRPIPTSSVFRVRPPSLPPLYLSLSSTCDGNFTSPWAHGWYFSLQTYAKATFNCDQLLRSPPTGLVEMI